MALMVRASVRLARGLIAFAVLGLAGCNVPVGESGVDRNLECAAYIGASTYLHVRGDIALKTEDYNKTLTSGMTYLNTYAIPNGISEDDAFAALNARRDDLMQTIEPAQVKSRALSCIRKAPKV